MKLINDAKESPWVHPKPNQYVAMSKLVTLGVFRLNAFNLEANTKGFEYTKGSYVLTDFGAEILRQLIKLSWSKDWDQQTVEITNNGPTVVVD